MLKELHHALGHGLSRAASTPPEIFGTLAFPGADSTFSRLCGGLSERLFGGASSAGKASPGSGRAKTPACSRAASTPPEIFGTVAIPGADSIFSRRCDGFSGGCNCQLCHARGGGHPGPRSDEGVISRKRDNLSERRPWIPAFAGMTRSNVLPASGLRRWASGRWRAARENLPNNRAHALPAHGENGAAILASALSGTDPFPLGVADPSSAQVFVFARRRGRAHFNQ